MNVRPQQRSHVGHWRFAPREDPDAASVIPRLASVPIGRDSLMPARETGRQAGGRVTPATPSGVLAAVCGLCGGAGTSALAMLIARWATRPRQADGAQLPVLAIDLRGTTAGLSFYVDAESPRSLAELAEDLGSGVQIAGRMFVAAGEGLRVIAAPPRQQPVPDASAVGRILGDARAAHRLTLVDCGTVGSSSQSLACDLATHVVWTMLASDDGVRRADLVLRGVPALAARELIVARPDPAAPKARTRGLTRLAEARQASLVLMPNVPEFATTAVNSALEVCSVALQALESRLGTWA